MFMEILACADWCSMEFDGCWAEQEVPQKITVNI